MSRVLAIFKKDVKHLRPQILIFLAVLVLSAIEDPMYVEHEVWSTDLINLLPFLLPLSCWLLVTSVIQEERPTDREQYWVTRPFTVTDLLAAKALFLLALVIIPGFVCESVVLAVSSHSPGVQTTALAVKQVFFLASFLMPVVAIGAVTKNLGEAILGGILVLLPLALASAATSRSGWNGLDWIRETLVAIVALCGMAAVIHVQYRWRRAGFGRTVLFVASALVVLALAIPPVQGAFVFQSWFSKQRIDPQEARISFDPGLNAAERTWYLGGPTAYLRVPIRLENLPPNLGVVADWVLVEAPWRSDWSGKTGISRDALGKRSLRLLLDPPTFERLKDVSIHVRGSIDLTLVAPSCARCRQEASDSTYCVWDPQSYAPFPTSPWFGPLEHYKHAVVDHPVAHIQRSFDLGPLRMGDFLEGR